MWGRMASCGGLKTRPERRFPTGAQLDKLPHNRTVPHGRSASRRALSLPQNSYRNSRRTKRGG